MNFTPSISTIIEDDGQLQKLLSDPGIELPPLLPSLAFALNDLSILPTDFSLDPTKTLEEQGGLTNEEQEKVRSIAFTALQRLRDQSPATTSVNDDDLKTIMSWACGTNLNGPYLQMLKEELSPNDMDLRSPNWGKDDIASEKDFTVAIIGAGMSGILAAYRLKQAGVSFVLFEKNSGIGGTWLENTYPGCRVDVSNHVYCYSFMQKHDWPHFHSTQDVLLQYFNDCADIFGIRENIRFNTSVSTAVWDENTGTWNLDISSSAGEEKFICQSVISAVGQLNRPSYPDIPGVASFQRDSWHSAQWNHDYNFSGKNVAVIGTGCSAVQFTPRVAEVAANTTIFQRTPNWLMPRPQYQQRLPESLLWCFDHIPHYHNWFRLHLFWRSHEGLLPRLELDPEWENPGDNSISSENHELGLMLRLYLQSEFSEDSELLEKVTPNFTLGAKRFVIDDGLWAATLRRDSVKLCTEEITSITETGIETVDGEHTEFDAIIYGTGFKASEFLTPMKVIGAGGIDLHEQWDGDASAYLGIVAPNFPNFFFLYGPNTNIVINGSIIYFSECEVHYITQSIKYLLESDLQSVTVKQDIHDAYNKKIDAGNSRMAWGLSDVNSWYKNASGRTAQNWPFSLLEYWEQTREIDPADYDIS